MVTMWINVIQYSQTISHQELVTQHFRYIFFLNWQRACTAMNFTADRGMSFKCIVKLYTYLQILLGSSAIAVYGMGDNIWTYNSLHNREVYLYLILGFPNLSFFFLVQNSFFIVSLLRSSSGIIFWKASTCFVHWSTACANCVSKFIWAPDYCFVTGMKNPYNRFYLTWCTGIWEKCNISVSWIKFAPEYVRVIQPGITESLLWCSICLGGLSWKEMQSFSQHYPDWLWTFLGLCPASITRECKSQGSSLLALLLITPN